MTKQDKRKINYLLLRVNQIEDELKRFRLFDNQIEANYNRVFDWGVTNRIMLDEQCRKIGELKAKFEAKSCGFVKTAQTHAVQEFAEKLRKRLTENRASNDNVVINANYEIDELLKEYE